MKLNLGCGTNKIEGFVNVDADSSVNPDQCWDFTQKFPLENESVELITLYHVIEHLPKNFRDVILSEIHRVLIPGGSVIITYPEFLKCVYNWKHNVGGKRDFWEATLYGRQLSKFDHHITIMDSDQFCLQLVRNGFEVIVRTFEKLEPFNAVVKARKVPNYTYEKALCETVGFKEKR